MRSRTVYSSLSSATHAIRVWPWAIRCSTALRAPPWSSSRTVSASMPSGGRSRKTARDGRREVAVVGAGGDDQQRVDAAAQQRGHELPLALGVLAGGGGDEEEAAVARGRLDRLGDGGVERVGDVLDHEPERGGGAAVAQRGGEVVALEAELGDRGGHALGGRGGDPGLGVDHARDRFQAHAGHVGDVTHGRARGVHGHDNVVNRRDAIAPAQLVSSRTDTVARWTSRRSSTRPTGRSPRSR